MSVGYATSNNTAISGSDYFASSGILNWGPGESSSKIFQVNIINDFAPEAVESLNLSLTGPTGGATSGVPSMATLLIIDDDSPGPPPAAGALRFSQPSYSQTETGA